MIGVILSIILTVAIGAVVFFIGLTMINSFPCNLTDNEKGIELCYQTKNAGILALVIIDVFGSIGVFVGLNRLFSS